MSTLSRYALRELTLTFAKAIVVVAALIVLAGVAVEAMRSGVGPVTVIRLVPYLLPDALVYAIPATLLLASTIVYGRLSADNEFLAIRSLGIGPGALLAPAAVLAILLTAATVYLYELGAVWGYYGAQRVVLEAVDDVVYSQLRTQRSISRDGFSIVVRDVQGRKLIQPTFTLRGDGGGPDITLQAEEAELCVDGDANVLTLVCRNGEVSTADGRSLRFPDTIRHHVPLSRAPPDSSRGAPAHLPLYAISHEIEQEELALERLEQGIAVQAAFQLLTGDFGDLAGAQWHAASEECRIRRDRWHRLRVEPPRRWAAGFSCLCFAAVGAPLAILRRSADYASSFFVCFLPILLVYYPFQMLGLDRAKAGAVPPYTVWLGNLALCLWGAWLIRRVYRR